MQQDPIGHSGLELEEAMYDMYCQMLEVGSLSGFQDIS
jgi:hypothetical protein